MSADEPVVERSLWVAAEQFLDALEEFETPRPEYVDMPKPEFYALKDAQWYAMRDALAGLFAAMGRVQA
jgi:hypothetical protein